MYIHNVGNKHRPREQNNEPCIKVVKRIIPKMFQIVPHVITYLSWKFHENLFIHFIVMLHKVTAPRLDKRPWNILFKCETV